VALADIYAAVDLGGTKIACALASGSGEWIAEESAPTQSSDGPEGVLARIGGLLAKMSAGTRKTPAAIGMGVPGLVDLENGRTRFLPNFPGHWPDVPAAGILSTRLGCPVFLLNDARMATLGELTFGHGRGVRGMLLFTLGTGIGGGVVVDGALQLGPLGAAGELGHQTILPDGPRCGCGSRGCLETLASGPAITAEGVRLFESGLAPKLHEITRGNVAAVTPREMALAAEAGDELVREAIVRAASYLGIGIANLVSALHPELVVLSGGVAAIGDLLLNAVRAEVRRRVRMFPVDELRIERSVLAEKAGLSGGIALATMGGIRPSKRSPAGA
jgi:glucokinase